VQPSPRYSKAGKYRKVYFQPLKIARLKNTTSLRRKHRLLYVLFQADTLQKHLNSALSKSEDFSNVEFIGMEAMVKYSKDCKEQALLLSDYIRVKKAAAQLGINYYMIAERRKARSRKAREERIASDKIPLNERELAMQREIQEVKKARFNCVNQILLSQLNVKFSMRKRAY